MYWNIYGAIIDSPKRMQKLRSLTGHARYDQIEKYIVAESQIQHIKVTEKESAEIRWEVRKAIENQ